MVTVYTITDPDETPDTTIVTIPDTIETPDPQPIATASVVGMVAYMELRLAACSRRAIELDGKGAKIKNRIYWARALEAALFLYSVTDTSLPGRRAYWEGYIPEIEAKVFNRKPQTSSPEEDSA